jgi:hypothetical protein
MSAAHLTARSLFEQNHRSAALWLHPPNDR